MFCWGLRHMIFKLQWHFIPVMTFVQRHSQTARAGLRSNTRMSLLNKQPYSQLPLEKPLATAKSRCAQHWRVPPVQVPPWQRAHLARFLTRCFQSDVQERRSQNLAEVWKLGRGGGRLVPSPGKPARWVSVLLTQLGFFSNCKHQ